jgi:hypothetical protein
MTLRPTLLVEQATAPAGRASSASAGAADASPAVLLSPPRISGSALRGPGESSFRVPCVFLPRAHGLSWLFCALTVASVQQVLLPQVSVDLRHRSDQSRHLGQQEHVNRQRQHRVDPPLVVPVQVQVQRRSRAAHDQPWVADARTPRASSSFFLLLFVLPRPSRARLARDLVFLDSGVFLGCFLVCLVCGVVLV